YNPIDLRANQSTKFVSLKDARLSKGIQLTSVMKNIKIVDIKSIELAQVAQPIGQLNGWRFENIILRTLFKQDMHKNSIVIGTRNKTRVNALVNGYIHELVFCFLTLKRIQAIGKIFYTKDMW
ncbi:hypothetical protein ACJX0J_038671, partial [Zea mays]